MRRIGLSLLVLLAAVLLLVIGAWFFVTSGPGERLILSKVSEETAKALPGNLTVGGLDLSANTIVLTDLVLRDPEGEVVARIARLEATFGLLNLLGRQIDIHRARVVKPELFLVQDERGLNLVRAIAKAQEEVEEKQGPTDATVRVSDFAIEDGTVDFRQTTMTAVTQHAHIDGLTASGEFLLVTLQEKMSGKLKLGGTLTAPTSGPLSIDSRFSKDPSALEADLTAALAGFALDGKVRRTGTERERLEITRLQAPTSTLKPLLPSWPLTADAALHGSVVREGNIATLDLHATAAGARVDVGGAIDIARLRAVGVTVDAKDVNFAELVENGPESNVSLSLEASGGGTSLETLDGQVDLTVPKAGFQDQTLGPIELHATAKDGAFQLSQLQAHVPGASLTAKGAGTLQDLVVDGELRASNLALLGSTVGRIVAPEGLPLSGAGALSFSLRGPPKHPGVTVSGSFASLRYDVHRVDGLRLKATLPDVRRPLDADADLEAKTLQVGERTFREVRAAVVTRGRDLTADLQAEGFANVAVHVAGTLDADRQGLALADLQLRYPEATWKLQQPTHVAFGGDVRVDELVLESGRQRIAVSALLRQSSRLEAKARIENLDLERLPRAAVPESLNLRGQLNADITARGTTAQPIADAKLTLRNGRVTKFDDLGLELDAHYEKDRASGELRAIAFRSGVKGSFSVPVAGLLKGTKEPVALDLAIEPTQLELLFAALDVDPGLRGKAAATIHIEGTAADPRGRVVIDGDQVKQEKGPAGDLDLIVESGSDGKLSARIDLDTMGSQNFILLRTPFTAGQFLHQPVTGRMFLETPVELEASFRDVPMQALRAWDLVAADVQGTASLTLNARGAVLAPTGKIHLAVKQMATGMLQPLDAYATVTATDAQVRLALTALRGQARLADIEGVVASSLGALFQKKNPDDIAVTLDGDLGPVTLKELQAIATVEASVEDTQRPDGLVTAKLTADGTLGDPKAELRLTADRLGVGNVALGRVDLDYRYAQALSDANVVLTSSRGGRMDLTAKARMDLSSRGLRQGVAWKDAPVEAKLVSRNFDPSFLAGLSETVRQIGGTIDADATVTGSASDPRFRGNLEWRDGRIALMGYGAYRNVHVAMEGTNDHFVLKDLTAQSGTGALKFAARADRTGNQYALTGSGQFTRFPIIADDQLRAILSGRLTFNGDATDEVVFVRELAIPEAHIELPEVRRKDLQDLDRPDDIVLVRKGEPLYAKRKKPAQPTAAGGAAQAGADAGAPGAAGATPPGRQYRILVNAPRNIWVRGTDVNAEIGLSEGFRIEYTDRALLFGEVRFIRGRVDVLGRRFDVLKDSQVRFAGPARLPYINITAEHANEREQVAVFTTIRGQGTDVTLKVTSTPALSDSEIYTLLATGRRTLKRGSGASMTGAEAASVVGAYAASQVKKVISQQVPLDVLSIEAGAQGLADATLEAGTYLTDKIYIGSIYRLGADPEENENAAGFRLEYQISPRWSFETEYGTARSGGADLIWSRDY